MDRIQENAQKIRENLAPQLQGLRDIFNNQLKPALKEMMTEYNKMLDALGMESTDIIEPLIYLLAGIALGLTAMAKASKVTYEWTMKLIQAVERLGEKFRSLPVGAFNSPVSLFNALNDTKATGGISGGGMTLVGEAGPELVNLPRGSHVYNNKDSQEMASGGDIIINLNSPVYGVDNLKASIIEAVNEATARQNRLANYNLL